jgi:hypothetical protein
MKNMIQSFKYIFLASFCLLINSCNDDLNLVEGSVELPIVYGFLSLNDTSTYIRVEKAFVDEKIGAPQLAKIADSIYYKSINVTLVRIRNNERFVLQRVDGNTEGVRRDTGVFANTPNILYKIKTNLLNLVADETWRIELQKAGDSKVLAKSKPISVVGAYTFFSPDPNSFVTWSSYTSSFSARIQSEEQSARFYDLRVYVNYDEVVGSNRVPKQAIWLVANGQPRRGLDVQTTFSKQSREFFNFLATSLSNTTTTARYFKDFDIELIAGGQELLDYQAIGIANLGITGSQAIPTFTNIENGLGIFTSRSRAIVKGIKLNDQAMELLKTGELTRTLNFK